MHVKAETLLLLVGMIRQIYSLKNKGENKALLMPANQSSTLKYQDTRNDYKGLVFLAAAGLAVDGKASNNFYDWTCTHTAGTLETHWWEVDLRRMTTINYVHILNRGHAPACVYKRLHDFVIDVFERSTEPRKKRRCADHPGAAGHGWVNLTCGSPPTGRYVRISKQRNDEQDQLALCEVEIYGQYVTRHIRHPYGVKLCEDLREQHNSSCVQKEFIVESLTCSFYIPQDEDDEWNGVRRRVKDL